MTKEVDPNLDIIAHRLHAIHECGGTPSQFFKSVGNTILFGYRRAKMLMFRHALKYSVNESKDIIFSHPIFFQHATKKHCTTEFQMKNTRVGDVLGTGSEGSVRPVLIGGKDSVVLKKSIIGSGCVPKNKRIKGHGEESTIIMKPSLYENVCIRRSLSDKNDETCIDVLGSLIATLIGSVMLPITAPIISEVRVKDSQNIPYQLMWMIKLDGTLYDAIDNEGFGTSEHVHSFITQLTLQLGCLQFVAGLVHSDLLIRNVMFKRVSKDTVLYYEHRGELFGVPTFGWAWRIIDFGWSAFKLRESEELKEFRSRVTERDNYDPFRRNIDLCGILYAIMYETAKLKPWPNEPCKSLVENISNFDSILFDLLRCMKKHKNSNTCIDDRIKGNHGGAADSRFPYNPTLSPGVVISRGLLSPYRIAHLDSDAVVFPVLYENEPLTVFAIANTDTSKSKSDTKNLFLKKTTDSKKLIKKRIKKIH